MDGSLIIVFTIIAAWSTGIHASEVCYHEYNIGCFQNNAPGNALPQSPAHQQVEFLLYTRKNPTNPQHLSTDANTIKSSNYDGKKNTKFVIHGHTAHAHRSTIHRIRDAFLTKEDANVILVNWEKGADNPKDYIKSATNTRVVGALIANVMKALHNTAGATYKSMHLVGHSLGAHTAGYAGARVKPGRITGLDPAGPFFENSWNTFRLDSSDADFVDVIHTNGKPLVKGGLGTQTRMGHVDFYPNGGANQPGCSSNLWEHIKQGILKLNMEAFGKSYGCSHRRALLLFAESINSSCKFKAYKCDSYDDFKAGKCNKCGLAGCANMGYPVSRWTRGKFYLNTNTKQPYCMFTLSDMSLLFKR